MPHLTLEYTANIPLEGLPGDLFPELHKVLARVAPLDIGNCKSRARRLEDFHVATGESDGAFVHLDVRLLAGRSDEVKRTIGEELLVVLERSFGKAATGLDVQVTVEVRDIRREEYFKTVLGTPPID